MKKVILKKGLAVFLSLVMSLFAVPVYPAAHADTAATLSQDPSGRLIPTIPVPAEGFRGEEFPKEKPSPSGGELFNPFGKWGDGLSKPKAEEKTEVSEEPYRRYERASMEEAMEQVRGDYAVAMIIDPTSLAKGDLEKLPKLEAEVALVVIEGELVMFTSGSNADIRTLPESTDLLAGSDFVMHSHVQGFQETPSDLDYRVAFNHLGQEYLVSSGGAYAFNSSGHKKMDYQDIFSEIQAAISTSNEKALSQVEVRQKLNDFIVQMDELNRVRDDTVIFRAAVEQTVTEAVGHVYDAEGRLTQWRVETRDAQGSILSYKDEFKTYHENGLQAERKTVRFTLNDSGQVTKEREDIHTYNDAGEKLRTAQNRWADDGITPVRSYEYSGYVDGKWTTFTDSRYEEGSMTLHQEKERTFHENGERATYTTEKFAIEGNAPTVPKRIDSKTYDDAGSVLTSKVEIFEDDGTTPVRTYEYADYVDGKWTTFTDSRYEEGSMTLHQEKERTFHENGEQATYTTEKFAIEGNAPTVPKRIDSKTYDDAGSVLTSKVEIFEEDGTTPVRTYEYADYVDGKWTTFTDSRYEEGSMTLHQEKERTFHENGERATYTTEKFAIEGNAPTVPYQTHSNTYSESGAITKKTVSIVEADGVTPVRTYEYSGYDENGKWMSFKDTRYEEGNISLYQEQTRAFDALTGERTEHTGVRFVPDENGDLQKNRETSKNYDNRGRVIARTDARYDEDGTLKKSFEFFDITYDESGNKLTESYRQYNEDEELVKTVVTDGRTYNDDGKITGLTRSNYDASGNLTRKNIYSGMEYNENGKRISQTREIQDAAGETLKTIVMSHKEYNNLGKVTGWKYEVFGSEGEIKQSYEYFGITYNEDGQRLTQHKRIYDENGDLVKIIKETDRTYDEDGKFIDSKITEYVDSVDPTESIALIETFGYNALNRSALPGYVSAPTAGQNDEFSYRYDVGAGEGATVDAVFNLFNERSLDLSAGAALSLERLNKEAASSGIARASVIFVDRNGNKITQTVDLLEGANVHNFDLNVAGFDASRVEQIIIRLRNQDLSGTYEQKQLDRRGEMRIAISQIQAPIIAGETYHEDALSLFNDDVKLDVSGTVLGSGTLPGYITLGRMIENGRFPFRYDVGTSNGAAVTVHAFRENDALLSLPNLLTIAMKNAGDDSQAIIRMTDASGKRAAFTLALTEVLQNFTLDLSDARFVESGFDRSQIAILDIFVSQETTATRKGEMEFQFAGIKDISEIIYGKNRDSESAKRISQLIAEANFKIFGRFASREDPTAIFDEAGNEVEGIGIRYNIKHAAGDEAGVRFYIPSGETFSLSTDQLFQFSAEAEAITSQLDGPIHLQLTLLDAQSEMVTVLLKVVEGVKLYEVDLSAYNPNFNADEIKEIEFKTNQEIEVNNRHAKFNVWLKGLAEELKVDSLEASQAELF